MNLKIEPCQEYKKTFLNTGKGSPIINTNLYVDTINIGLKYLKES